MKWCRKLVALFVFVFSFLSSSDSFGQKFSLAERFAISDAARGLHPTGIRTEFFVESFDGKISQGRQRYVLRGKGASAQADLIGDSGQILQAILVLGDDFWLVKPTSARPVRISTQDRATGIASVGDIMATHFSLGYTLVRDRQSVLKGKKFFHANFSPKGMLAAYQEVVAWLDPATNLVVRATYSIEKSKVAKTIDYEYRNTIGVDKKPFVSKMKIDSVDSRELDVVVDFEAPEEEPLSDDWFKFENVLGRVKKTP